MANSKLNSNYYQYAKVDTNPDSPGFFTDPLSIRSKRVDHVNFSIRGSGSMTVKLQFKCPEDADWTDYVGDEIIEPGCRLVVTDIADGVEWRAGVANSDYTSGELTFGFDWKKIYTKES